jgi:hypothetical protein
MYSKFHVGCTQLTVGVDDTKYDVWLPPFGYGYDPVTKRVEKTDVICSSDVTSEQVWVRPEPPEDYDERRKKEIAVRGTVNKKFVDRELQAYRRREWHRRIYGCWFYNNGVAEYLTGDHYFFLTHWPLDEGYADFRIPDRDTFYFWAYCEDDPMCFGGVELTKRRQGKTARTACKLFARVSRMNRVHGGIQSKNAPDARDIFQDHIVTPFLSLPDFFIPEYDRETGIAPKSALRFFKTNKRGAIDESYDDIRDLKSWIDHKPAGVKAYDGKKLIFYMCDETAKTDTDVDVYKRHLTARKCLLDKAGDLRGKAYYTTTVEDMDPSAEGFRKLWVNSDFNNKKNGITESRLYRWFMPAYMTKNFDRYGYPNVDLTRSQYETEWASITDSADLAKARRQDPFIWQDAFRPDGDSCAYNAQKLAERFDAIRWKPPVWKRYSLIWDGVEKRAVRAAPDATGRFYIAQMPIRENDVVNGVPRGSSNYVIGIDPFDHVKTKDGKFSLGAAAVYMMPSGLDSFWGDNFVAIYLGRPQHPHIFYEDMVKLCHFYGCRMLYEDQKQGIRDYFETNGRGAFFVCDERGDPGISASTRTHIEIAENTEIFIEDNCHKVVFGQLLEDWMYFDFLDTTKFDLGMASGYALIAASKVRRRLERMNQIPQRKVTDFFRKFNLGNKGAIRRRGNKKGIWLSQRRLQSEKNSA